MDIETREAATGARHHDAGATGGAAGGGAGIRRRGRHPIWHRRRCFRRNDRRSVRLEPGQARSACAPGRTPTKWRCGTSYAYSDSFFDGPLLAAVGYPTAVNPDARLAVLATLKRWPVRWFDKPEGVAKVAGLELQELLRPFVNEALIPNVRFEFSGLEHLPETGGAIVCGNHRSYFDPAAIAITLAKRNRNARFLGKKEVFDAPVVGAMAKAMGGIRRGTRHRVRPAARRRRCSRCRPAMWSASCPRGPSREGLRSSNPSWWDGGALPGWPSRPGCR